MRQFIDPGFVVTLHRDGKPTAGIRRNRYWSLPFLLVYSAMHPRKQRRITNTYRVYRTLDEPTAPFILVRGEPLYLTPGLTRKVLS